MTSNNSVRKTRYLKDELFRIRETLGLGDRPHLAAPQLTQQQQQQQQSAPGQSGRRFSNDHSTQPPPPLPSFGAPRENTTPVEQTSGRGSLRDGLFGANSTTTRKSATGSHADLASAVPVTASAVSGGASLWVYRTKVGSMKPSTPMMLSEIQQLISDELVEEDDIELRNFSGDGDGIALYVTFKEALAATASAVSLSQSKAADAKSSLTSSSQGDRWRPSAPVSLDQRRASGSRPSGSSTTAAGASGRLSLGGSLQQQQQPHLPVRHMTLSREDMMSEEAKRRSPATTPQAHCSPVAMLPPPIGEDTDLSSADCGLGVVGPLPTVPRPPLALDVDDVGCATAANVVHGGGSLSTSITNHPSTTPSRAKLMPVSSVDDDALTPPVPPAAPCQLSEAGVAESVESQEKDGETDEGSSKANAKSRRERRQEKKAGHAQQHKSEGDVVAEVPQKGPAVPQNAWGNHVQQQQQQQTASKDKDGLFGVPALPAHVVSVGAWGVTNATTASRGSDLQLYPSLDEAILASSSAPSGYASQQKPNAKPKMAAMLASDGGMGSGGGGIKTASPSSAAKSTTPAATSATKASKSKPSGSR